MTTRKARGIRPVNGLVGLLHKRIARLEVEKVDARYANPPNGVAFTEASFRQAESRMWLSTVLEVEAKQP